MDKDFVVLYESSFKGLHDMNKGLHDMDIGLLYINICRLLCSI